MKCKESSKNNYETKSSVFFLNVFSLYSFFSFDLKTLTSLPSLLTFFQLVRPSWPCYITPPLTSMRINGRWDRCPLVVTRNWLHSRMGMQIKNRTTKSGNTWKWSCSHEFLIDELPALQCRTIYPKLCKTLNFVYLTAREGNCYVPLTNWINKKIFHGENDTNGHCGPSFLWVPSFSQQPNRPEDLEEDVLAIRPILLCCSFIPFLLHSLPPSLVLLQLIWFIWPGWTQ